MSGPFKYSIKMIGKSGVSLEALFTDAGEPKAIIDEFYSALRLVEEGTTPAPIRFSASNGEFVIDPTQYSAFLLVNLDTDEWICTVIEARKLRIIEAVQSGMSHGGAKMQ